MLPLVIALAGTVPLAAGEPKKAADGPEDVARRAMAALKEDRLDDFAKAMHPDALKQFKSFLVSIADGADRGGQADEFLRLFAGVKTVDELKKLDDGPFFVAFFRGLTRLSPEFGRALAGAQVQVIGHVPEGTDTAHVVTRMTMTVEGTKVTKVDVISMRKTETGWAMLLSGDLENAAKSLKRQFGGEKK